MAVVRVRCSVSFPDVVQQARALQLCVDALARETLEAGYAPYQQVISDEKAEVRAKKEPKEFKVLRQDASWFVLLRSFAWESEFNNYIASLLENAGYPRLLTCNQLTRQLEQRFAPVLTCGPPLSLMIRQKLQRNARKSVLKYTVKTVTGTGKQSDVVF